MSYHSVIPFKVYLIHNDSAKPEIRRFGISPENASHYVSFMQNILKVFPGLSDKVFQIYWKDNEGDEIAVSSDEELIIAHKVMAPVELKTFYVKVQAPKNDTPKLEGPVLHPGVFCDECNCNIAGFRYKCLVCKDYDLCSACERAGIHAEHPLLRFTNRFCFDRMKLRKIDHAMHSLNPVIIEIKRPRRHHSHEGGHPESCKRKKRCDKRESDSETADESDDGCHKKHSHKKWKKFDKCGFRKPRDGRVERRRHFRNRFSRAGPYSDMNSAWSWFYPFQFQPSEGTEKLSEGACHTSYLRSIGSTLQKLLDPLGVSVELEFRSKGERDEEKKKDGNKQENQNEEQTSPPSPSAPSQKEVRFQTHEKISETMKQKIDELTKIFANQTMNRSPSADNDGWVSFEELKKDSEPQRKETPDATVKSGSEGNSSESDKKEAESSFPPGETLYPNLKPQSQDSSNPRVNAALEKMLAMGFSNDGNWLTHLLEAKDGDINQVLEVLTFQKRN